jgi:hypothetical protein
VLEPNRIRKVPTDIRGHEVEAGHSCVGPPRCEPAKSLVDLLPPLSDRNLRAKNGHWVLRRGHGQPGAGVAVA